MKLKFLGTGTSQGIPVIGSTHPVCLSTDQKDKRLRSSVMITDDDGKKILIDCGQIFANKCSPIKKTR
jgi:phosphoribosyl 1,2-cyclic phosphate phosphodiesterase